MCCNLAEGTILRDSDGVGIALGGQRLRYWYADDIGRFCVTRTALDIALGGQRLRYWYADDIVDMVVFWMDLAEGTILRDSDGVGIALGGQRLRYWYADDIVDMLVFWMDLR
jgi:hypothetical protein